MFPITRWVSPPAIVVKKFRWTKMIASVRVQEFSSVDTIRGKMCVDVEASYTAEQQNSILKKVNSWTMEELMRYNITEARLKKLTAHRDRYGEFKSVNEVLLMQGIDIDVLNKFCRSLVKGEFVAKEKSVTSKGELLTPALDVDVRTAINTSTGIWVCGNVISWAQLDKGCNLLNWECETLEDVAMKDGLVAVVEAVANIVSKVPVSHAYTMETEPIIPFSRMNSVAYYLQLQRQQIVSTIVSLLGTREKRFGDTNGSINLTNNVYMMRSRTPARLFDLLVGTEIVSARTVVEKMLNSYNVDADIRIFSDASVLESYRSQDIFAREQMNWALLLTSAFVNISLLRTSSLKKSTKKSRDKPKIQTIVQ